MKNVFMIIFFCWCLYLFSNENGITCAPYDGKTLELVSVLFRHGNRTPNGPDELYPKDPYRQFRYKRVGIGQLTNAGKVREYRIGKALRKRYDHFLGPYYSIELIEPVSTDYNRTKMSLLLVLHGLFPAHGEQVWQRGLDWQPIPYNYLPREQDKVLLGSLCPYYLKLYDAYVQSPKMQAEFNKYRDIVDYISNNTGLNITKFQDIYNLNFGLNSEKEYGLRLPPWTTKVFPEPMRNLSIQEYYVATGTTELRQMAAGYYIQQLTTDVYLKINGSTPNRKIYLNSAHEDNIAKLLITLGVFDPPHIPEYGSYVIFELHRIQGSYGIKIYYQNYVSDEPKLLKLPACDTFCEIDKFAELVQEYIPPSDMCYWK